MYILSNEDNEVVRFPFPRSEIRSMYPKTSFPYPIPDEVLALFHVFPVEDRGMPVTTKEDYDPTIHKLTLKPIYVESRDVWKVQYVVTDRDEGSAITQVRAKAIELLSDTNDEVLSYTDAGQEIPAELTNYRAELNAIDQQEGYPFNVTWPTRGE